MISDVLFTDDTYMRFIVADILLVKFEKLTFSPADISVGIEVGIKVVCS